MSKELAKTTSTVGGMTLVSRVLGLARDSVIAFIFGAGPETEAYMVAFRLPNLFRRLFAEGAFAAAFIPVLSEYHRKEDAKAMRLFIACMAGDLSFILILFTILGILLAPLFIFISAPGFVAHGAQYALATELLRITFPYLLFVSLASFMGSVLNVYGVFWVSALSPALLNIAIIGCAFALSPFFQKPIVGLAWGVFLGGVLQVLFQLPHLRRLHLLPRLRVYWQHPGVRRVLKLMIPTILGVSVGQINLLVDTLIASFLEQGSIAWLGYSDRIMEFPLGVFGIALSTTIMPHLSKRHAAQDPHQFSQTLDWGVRSVLLIALPATLGLAFLSKPLLMTLFQYGKFLPHDVLMASNSLIAYASGLVAYILVKVFASGYYARQDTKTPVRIAVFTMILNIGLNIIFIFPLRYVGIALAMSCAAFTNAFLLFRGLYRANIYRPARGTGVFLVRVVLGCVAMVLVIMWCNAPFSTWLGWNIWQRGLHLGAIILAAMGTYFVVLWMVGMRFSHFKGLSDSRTD